MAKRLLDSEFDLDIEAHLTSRHVISDLVLASSFDDDNAPAAGEDEFDYEEEALADFGLSSSHDPRRRSLLAAALAAVGRKVPLTPSPVSSGSRSGDVDGDALDLNSSAPAGQGPVTPTRPKAKTPKSTITFVQEPVGPWAARSTDDDTTNGAKDAASQDTTSSDAHNAPVTPPPVPPRQPKRVTSSRKHRSDSTAALVADMGHRSDGENASSDDDMPISSSANMDEIFAHESKTMGSDLNVGQDGQFDTKAVDKPHQLANDTRLSGLSQGLRGGSSGSSAGGSYVSGLSSALGASLGSGGHSLANMTANRGVFGDLFRCTVYFPFLPREHDADEPHLIQLQVSVDCTAQSLVALARHRFVQDLHHRPELIGPVLGNHIRRLRCRRLQIEYVPIPIPSETANNPALSGAQPKGLADEGRVYGVPTISTQGPGKLVHRSPSTPTSTLTTSTTLGAPASALARTPLTRRTPTVPARVLSGSGQRGRTRIQGPQGTPLQGPPSGGLSGALSSQPYRAVNTVQSGLARALQKCALTREEMDFTVEDVFGQTLQYELVVWDLERGVVNDDIPPLHFLSRPAKQDYDIFALQIIPNAAASRAHARHLRRMAKRQQKAAKETQAAAATQESSSTAAEGTEGASSRDSTVSGDEVDQNQVVIAEDIEHRQSYSDSKPRSQGSDSSEQRRRAFAMAFGHDYSDTEMSGSVSGTESVFDPFAYDGVEESADSDSDDSDLDEFARDSDGTPSMGRSRSRGTDLMDDDDDSDDDDDMGFVDRRGRRSFGGAPPPPPAHLIGASLSPASGAPLTGSGGGGIGSVPASPAAPPFPQIPQTSHTTAPIPPAIPPRPNLSLNNQIQQQQQVDAALGPTTRPAARSISCITTTTAQNSARPTKSSLLSRLFPCCCPALESIEDDDPNLSSNQQASLQLSNLGKRSSSVAHI